MSGLWAVVLISAVPLVVLLPLWACYRQPSQQLSTILLIALLSGGALTFYSISLLYTTVIRATLLFYLTPVWSTLISIFFLQESVKWNRWIAIVLGLSGLYFIVGGGSGGDSQPFNLGDWFGLVSGCCWGIAGVLIKKNAVTNITTLISWQHLFGFLLALICCLWLTGFEQIPEPSLWVSAGLAMAAYSWFGLIPSVFAILWASSRLFPGRVGILMMTEVLARIFHK